MDIERFKNLTIPAVQAGEISKLIRKTIKKVRDKKQDLYEKQSEDFKPITEKLDKETGEISSLRKEFVQAQPLDYQVRQDR